jgi:hypothetical protein
LVAWPNKIDRRYRRTGLALILAVLAERR